MIFNDDDDVPVKMLKSDVRDTFSVMIRVWKIYACTRVTELYNNVCVCVLAVLSESPTMVT